MYEINNTIEIQGTEYVIINKLEKDTTFLYVIDINEEFEDLTKSNMLLVELKENNESARILCDLEEITEIISEMYRQI